MSNESDSPEGNPPNTEDGSILTGSDDIPDPRAVDATHDDFAFGDDADSPVQSGSEKGQEHTHPEDVGPDLDHSLDEVVRSLTHLFNGS